MPSHSLRDRVEALIAALTAADVHITTLTLNGVTPEQLVDTYPDATVRRWVSRTGNRAVAIDAAKVPHYPRIEASRHREPTHTEMDKVRTMPYDDQPSQHYFEGSDDAA